MELIRIGAWLTVLYLFSSLYKVSLLLWVLACGFIVSSFFIKRASAARRLSKVGVIVAFSVILLLSSLTFSFLAFTLDRVEGFGTAEIGQEALVYGSIVFVYILLTLVIEKFPKLALLEAFFLALWALRLLEFHRGLNLAGSKFVHQVAAYFNTSELTAMLGLGSLIAALLVLTALYFSTSQKFRTTLIYVLFGMLVFVVGFNLLSWRYQSVDGRLSSGVGFENEPGVSPLNFDSAVGASTQATALVELTNSYFDPRTSPLLYLRETALSKLSGKVLVISDLEKDFSRLSPRQEFQISETSNTYFRKRVETRNFLLIEHTVPFAIDYPERIFPISNPNSEKFVGGAFGAISIAPQFGNEQLFNFEVGNPDWPEELRRMYLELPPDERYRDLALEITNHAQNQIEKINAVINFLNKNVIYTLKPNAPKTDDPVATFLFGSRRGYCVHLSHGAVYLFRALGIPARIGVGYATDLSQSRDGYILLRLNDRHAWPEVYFNGLGWLVFDSFPEQVESHAEAPVDQEFLKSLIQELEKNSTDNKPHQTVKSIERKSGLVYWLAGFLVLLYLFKFYLWFGYKIKSSRYRLALSILSRLYDQGFTRDNAEPLAVFLSKVDGYSDMETKILELFFGENVQLDEVKSYTKLTLRSLVSLSSVFRYFFVRTW